MTIELYAYRHPANWHWPRTLTLRLIRGDGRYHWSAYDLGADGLAPGRPRGYATLRSAERGAVRAGWTVQRVECPRDVHAAPYRHEVRP